MNIFWLHKDFDISAQQHNNRHCVSQCKEYAQLLSTAHHMLDGESSDLIPFIYKKTHYNHPCAVWAREYAENYLDLVKLLKCLCKEYTYRYGKIHKVERELLPHLVNLPKNIKQNGSSQPPACMPDEFKIYSEGSLDIIASYRNYYIKSKPHLAAWKNRETPSWFIIQ